MHFVWMFVLSSYGHFEWFKGLVDVRVARLTGRPGGDERHGHSIGQARFAKSASVTPSAG